MYPHGGTVAMTARTHRYLNGVEFPASKLDVIASAEVNGAPQAMIESLQRVKCEQFPSAEAVVAALLTDERARRSRPSRSVA